MISEISRRASFKVSVSPHLDALLQVSLQLTGNGRAATRLLRATIAEAFRSWTEPLPAADCKLWLRKVLTRQFSSDSQQHPRRLAAVCDQGIAENPLANNLLASVTPTGARSSSVAADELDKDVIYFRAIAGLPAVVRPVMILSCLEGFSSGEIANLAGVQSYAVESLLKRGRTLLQDELFRHLTDTGGNDAIGNPEPHR